MPQNPYEAPQVASSATGGIIAPYVTVQQLIPWQDPLRTQILGVARNQRWLNLHLLVAIVGGILYGAFGYDPKRMVNGEPALSIIGLLLVVLLIPNYVMLIVRIYQMVKSLDNGDSPLLAVLAMFIPLLGLIVLLFFSSKATKFLRQFGIPVGLLGANPAAIAKQLDQAALAANPAASPNSAPPLQLPPANAMPPGALPMAQAIPAPPTKPAPLPMGKPLVQGAQAKPAAPAGQLPVARPLPPVQPKTVQTSAVQPKTVPPKPPQAPKS